MIKYFCIILVLVSASCVSKKEVAQGAAPSDAKVLANAQAFYLQAEKERLNKDLTSAVKSLEQCIAINPKHAAAHYFLSIIKNKQNQFTDALNAAVRASELDNKNVYYKELAAELYVRNNKVDKAIELYKQLSDLQPQQYQHYQLLMASLYSYNGGIAQSMKILDNLEERYGTNDDLVYRRINIFKRTRDVKAVNDFLNSVIEKNPKEVRYRLCQIEILEDNKQYALITYAYKKLEDDFGNSPKAMPLIALNKLRMGDSLGFKNMLPNILSNAAIDPEDKRKIIAPYLQMNSKAGSQSKESVKYAKQILEAAPNDKEALNIYAEALEQDKQYKEAANVFNKILGLDAAKKVNWENTLQAYANAEQYDSVKAISKRALDYFPNQYTVYYYLGLAYQYGTPVEYNSALKQYKKALEYSPITETSAHVLGLIGDIHNSLKQYSASDSCYLKALDIDKRNYTVMNNYAYSLSNRGIQLEEALHLSKTTVDNNPNQSSFLDTYGWIYYKLNNYQEALVHINKSLELGESADVLDHLGDVLFKLNRTAEAVSAWRKAKEKGSTNSFLNKKIEDQKIYE
jgi:tetratricopeptide (TPR) repeat protein